MKRWLFFFVPFTVVTTLGMGVSMWFWVVGWPCDTYTQTDFFDLEPSTRCVTTKGLAHYEIVLNATVPGNGFFPDQTYFIYGLFPEGNSQEREVRVLVRTQRPPERMVSFETMEISGRVLPMDYRKIPFNAENQISKRSGYYFSDRVFLLEPDVVRVEGEDDWHRVPPKD